jgi:hypothetical protein
MKGVGMKERPIKPEGARRRRRAHVDLGVPSNIKILPVPGTGGKYFAGEDGHIYCYSAARNNARKPRPFRLSEAIWDNGYPLVSLILRSRKRTKAVHTCVCVAFHGTRPSPIHETRHLDGDKTNNKPDNLKWGTPVENEADKRRHGRASIGERHHSAKLNDEAVRILRAAIPVGLWNPVDAAKVFNVTESVIRSAVSRKTWRHIK